MKFALSALIFLSAVAFAADHPETPAQLEGAKVATAQEVDAALKAGAVVYDVRKKVEFAEKHIKGAKFLPYEEKSKKEVGYKASEDTFALGKPDDPNKAVVFYCNGSTCWKSMKSSKWALGLGYKNVLWFRGGMPEWTAAKLPTE